MGDVKHFGAVLLISLGSIFLFSCKNSKPTALPYIGPFKVEDGITIHHKIPPFSFLNQDSVLIDNSFLESGIYVSDFFYSYCPSVCPKVINQMLRIHDKFENDDRVKLVSFALDPKRDNAKNLKFYSENLSVDNKKWHFLTGNREEIWTLSESFLVSVAEDPSEPGGIYHSGKIILVDKKGHIRGFVNGTDENEVTDFMNMINVLLEE